MRLHRWRELHSRHERWVEKGSPAHEHQPDAERVYCEVCGAARNAWQHHTVIEK